MLVDSIFLKCLVQQQGTKSKLKVPFKVVCGWTGNRASSSISGEFVTSEVCYTANIRFQKRLDIGRTLKL